MSMSYGESGPLDNESASSERTAIQPLCQINNPELQIIDIEYFEREVKRFRDEAERSKNSEMIVFENEANVIGSDNLQMPQYWRLLDLMDAFVASSRQVYQEKEQLELEIEIVKNQNTELCSKSEDSNFQVLRN